MDKLQTQLITESNGVTVKYGQIPSGIISDWKGVVFFFQCNDVPDAEKHETIIKPIIEQLETQSYDHGSEWRHEKVEAVVWTEYCQITLVQFRIRDSY